MEVGNVVELIKDTDFYKKGKKAKIININKKGKELEIRYEGEQYMGGDRCYAVVYV